MPTIKIFFIGLFFLLSAPLNSVADGDFDESEGAAQPQADSGVNPASNASFDDRLPPVLPGEVLNDGHSKTKVWSTSGPVPVAPLVSPPQAPGNANAQVPVGAVIVDQRDDRKFDYRDGGKRHP